MTERETGGLPPELRDAAHEPYGHRPVRPAWWRAVAGVVALLCITALVLAYL